MQVYGLEILIVDPILAVYGEYAKFAIISLIIRVR